MRLKIKTLRFKNFLSFGNNTTELNFEDGKIALIVGKNGDGKSCFYEALFFGLYGKPFRKITKDGLVNTTNGKNTLVEIELETEDKIVKIVRGIKPTVFEIYVNGVLKNQEASSWDYQSWLEETILRMDERTFRQIVVLGSTSFVPFMALRTGERRAVVEDILSLGVYSTMLNLVKQRVSVLRQQAQDTQHAVKSQNIALSSFQRSLKDLADVVSVSSSGYREKKVKVVEQVSSIEQEKKEIKKSLEVIDWSSIQSQSLLLSDRINKAQQIKFSLEDSIRKIGTEVKFFEENDNCPTCHQPIDSKFKEDFVKKSSGTSSKKKEGLLQLIKTIEDLNSQHSQYSSSLKEIQTLTDKLKTIESNQLSLSKEIDFLEKKIAEIEGVNQSKIDELNAAIEDCNKKIKSFTSSLTEFTVALEDFEIMDGLLRDSGIKAKIIAERLPVINTLIKKYLEILDFPVHMTFNEDFSEVIRSRFKEEFYYGNLSAGEKMRIDLALLFTWREITRLSNSTACNLLILDEIGDSSLDSDGFESFMKILMAEKDNQSVVVISHKPYGFSNQVDRIIEVSKSDGFSKITKLTENEPEEVLL